MAALMLHSAPSVTLSSHRLLFHRRRERPKLLLLLSPAVSPPQRFSVCRASIRRPRAGRKVLSNVELRDEIKEFLSSAGLPEDHVPSTKELSLHGRTDLANIVRRRGYKLIRELLTSSLQMDAVRSDMQERVADEQADPAAFENDQKAENLAEQTDLSDEVSAEEEFPVTHYTCPDVTFSGDRYTNQEPPVVLYSDEKSSHLDGDGIIYNRTSSMGGATKEEGSSDLNLNANPNFHNIEHVPLELLSDQESASGSCSSFTGKVEELVYNGEDVSSPTDASTGEDYSQNSEFDSRINGKAGISSELPGTKTLEEKVATFLEDGYLDPVEDNLSQIYHEIGDEDSDSFGSPGFTDSERGVEIQQITTAEMQPLHVHGSNDPIILRESRSNSGSSPAYPLGDNHSSGEGLLDALMGKIVDTETSEGENEAEISQLRHMLHEKEVELSRLKREIEKEKLALSFLQTKAENEIHKVQKLISEKDAELQAAEESLSGLKEVEIQYRGDGDIVEVAGSFNGWHHRIKMDPQPFTNGSGSRKSRIWSTMLWLYPGEYEIKFVVDGQWVLDPEKESTTKGSICNNILQVDK